MEISEIHKAIRRGTHSGNLVGANLRGADLRGADLRWANLRGADLRWAELRRADLREADLREVNLRWADLRGADLRWADLRGADLRWADLNGADLRGADLRGTDLRGAELDFSMWPLWCGTFEARVDDRIVAQIFAHWARLDVSGCSPYVRYLHRKMVATHGKFMANLFCKSRGDVKRI